MPPDPAFAAHHFQAMGTSCSIFAAGARSGALLRAESQVRALAARLTRFEATSELSQVNASGGRWFAVSPELEALLRESLRAYELSAGLVNVAVLPSMSAIGYTRPLDQGATVARMDRAAPVPRLPDVLEVAIGRARLANGA